MHILAIALVVILAIMLIGGLINEAERSGKHWDDDDPNDHAD